MDRFVWLRSGRVTGEVLLNVCDDLLISDSGVDEEVELLL